MNKNISRTLEILNEIVSEILKTKNISLELGMTAEDVDGWDSLAHAQIIYNCEEKFNIRFSLFELAELKNIGDLINTIIKHKSS